MFGRGLEVYGKLSTLPLPCERMPSPAVQEGSSGGNLGGSWDVVSNHF